MTKGYTQLPADLPVPEDDAAGSHLLGAQMPDLALQATSGVDMNLAKLKGRLVLYIYPMTGQPGVPLPEGWDAIPGARGCTPQSCGFRDHYAELKRLNTEVFGLSTQTTEYQQEAKERLHLPFDLLSDHELKLQSAIGLPTFHVDDMTLYKRMVLIIESGVISKLFYPVFPPDKSAEVVLDWIKKNS